MWSRSMKVLNPQQSIALAHNANLISKAQTLINNFLKGKNTVLYAINPDGSVMELQSGCTLLSAERFQMEVYIGGNYK